MPSFMDKVKQAAGGVADATKKGAATAQTKAKIHGLRGKADEAAQKLGYLVHRERTGGEAVDADAGELVNADLRARVADRRAAGEPEEGGEDSADDETPAT